MSCSVCCEDNCASGGVLLFERSGLVSAICVECWETFSTATPASRRIKNEAQLAAAKVSFKIEYEFAEKFRRKLVLRHNCIIDSFQKLRASPRI